MDVEKVLEQNADWLIERQLNDGRFDIEMADYICIGGYNVRGLIAAYRVLGKPEYLEASLKWIDRVIRTQLEDGSFEAHILQGKDSYGRFQSDTANAMMSLFNVMPILEAGKDEKRINEYTQVLEKFSKWCLDGDNGVKFSFSNGATCCGVYKGDESNTSVGAKGRKECLECTAIVNLAFFTAFYHLTGNSMILEKIVYPALEYVLSRQENDGAFPYISKGMNFPSGKNINQDIHVLHYCLEGLFYFVEHSGIEFFDETAFRVRKAIGNAVKWLLDHQEISGRWGSGDSGQAAKSSGVLIQLAQFLKFAPQDQDLSVMIPSVKNAIDRCCGFLSSEKAVQEFGLRRNAWPHGLSVLALAEVCKPGISLAVADRISAPAEEEVFPLEILASAYEADSPFLGMKGWITDPKKMQVVFWHAPDGLKSMAHSHPYPEWGIVVSGYCDLTVEGKSRRYRPGDCFNISAGKVHSAVMGKNYRAVDLFANPEHIKVRKQSK